eukprot:TRINITY_DN9179_c0_g1_i6.p1 TRINITY_DN9179_c0_g1~~TRINITY_DN9179_c0_g1_i6.p1  ORF type:complete len:477 (-),score=73.24 TRINITY_DN9179_c0_g1_i6:299-1729(-)
MPPRSNPTVRPLARRRNTRKQPVASIQNRPPRLAEEEDVSLVLQLQRELGIERARREGAEREAAEARDQASQAMRAVHALGSSAADLNPGTDPTEAIARLEARVSTEVAAREQLGHELAGIQIRAEIGAKKLEHAMLEAQLKDGEIAELRRQMQTMAEENAQKGTAQAALALRWEQLSILSRELRDKCCGLADLLGALTLSHSRLHLMGTEVRVVDEPAAVMSAVITGLEMLAAELPGLIQHSASTPAPMPPPSIECQEFVQLTRVLPSPSPSSSSESTHENVGAKSNNGAAIRTIPEPAVLEDVHTAVDLLTAKLSSPQASHQLESQRQTRAVELYQMFCRERDGGLGSWEDCGDLCTVLCMRSGDGGALFSQEEFCSYLATKQSQNGPQWVAKPNPNPHPLTQPKLGGESGFHRVRVRMRPGPGLGFRSISSWTIFCRICRFSRELKPPQSRRYSVRLTRTNSGRSRWMPGREA